MDPESVQVKSEPVDYPENPIYDEINYIKEEPLDVNNVVDNYDYFAHELATIPSEPLFPDLIKSGSDLFTGAEFDETEFSTSIKEESQEDVADDTASEIIGNCNPLQQSAVKSEMRPTCTGMVNIGEFKNNNEEGNSGQIIIAKPKKTTNRETRPYARSTNSMECVYCGAKFSSRKWFTKHFCPQMGQQLHGLEIGSLMASPKKAQEDATKTKRNIYSTRKCRVCDQEFPTFSSMFEHFMSHYNLKKDEIKSSGILPNNQLIPGPSLLKPTQINDIHVKEEEDLDSSYDDTDEMKFSNQSDFNSILRKPLAVTPTKKQMPVLSPPPQLPPLTRAPAKQNKEWICKECGCCFTSQSQLVDHFLTHYNLTLKKATPSSPAPSPKKPQVIYTCNQCPGQFPSITRLRQHQQAVHTEEEAVQCKVCESWFNSQKYLLRHMQRKHEATAECNVCHQKFTEMDLPKHYLDHFNMKL